jgi:hypothetical protein
MSKSSTYQKGGGEEAAQEEISIHDQGVNDTAIMKELRLLRSAGSSYISPELFERLYFSPQNMVKGSLRRTFGNPTPMWVLLYRNTDPIELTNHISGVMGFVMAVAPMSCTLMGWGGAGGNGVAYT